MRVILDRRKPGPYRVHVECGERVREVRRFTVNRRSYTSKAAAIANARGLRTKRRVEVCNNFNEVVWCKP